MTSKQFVVSTVGVRNSLSIQVDFMGRGYTFMPSVGNKMLQVSPIPTAPTPSGLDVVKEQTPVLADIEIPEVVTTVPHLDELTTADRLYITKRLGVKNVLFLKGKKNKFYVRTSDQTLIYTVEERNRWWVGYVFYGLRPLQLLVSNTQGSEVMRIRRPYACTARVLPCYLQRLEVFAPPDHLIGTVEQQSSAIKPLYLVRNRQGEVVFWIRGPYITISFFKDIKFGISSTDGTPVGSTCKRWQGLMHALFLASISDKFGVAFEKDLSVEDKALLFAATLLMDYMYYDA